jgi:hypothetical protein
LAGELVGGKSKRESECGGPAWLKYFICTYSKIIMIPTQNLKESLKGVLGNKKGNRECEYYQSLLYVCMEPSQWKTPYFILIHKFFVALTASAIPSAPEIPYIVQLIYFKK